MSNIPDIIASGLPITNPNVTGVIQDQINATRLALAANETEALNELRRAWLISQNRIMQKLLALQTRILQNEGTPSRAWITQLEQYKALSAQITNELQQIALVLKDAQLQAGIKNIQAGVQDVTTQMTASLNEAFDGLANVTGVIESSGAGTIIVNNTQIPLNAPAPKALRVMVARLSMTNSPLYKSLLREFGNDSKKMIDRLITGLVAGENPRTVAADIQRMLQTPLYRAERIARTEILTAYRESNRATMQANNHIIKKWVWYANLSTCCASCLGMHGTTHDVSEPMGTHPNCRCVPVPSVEIIPELDDMNFGGDKIAEKARIDAMKTLHNTPRQTLKDRFGNAKGTLMYEGQVKLSELVTAYKSNLYGVFRREATVAELLHRTNIDITQFSGEKISLEDKILKAIRKERQK